MIKKFIFVITILLLSCSNVFAYDNTNYPRFVIFQGRAVNMNNIISMRKYKKDNKHCIELVSFSYADQYFRYCYPSQQLRDSDFNKVIRYNIIK